MNFPDGKMSDVDMAYAEEIWKQIRQEKLPPEMSTNTECFLKMIFISGVAAGLGLALFDKVSN